MVEEKGSPAEDERKPERRKRGPDRRKGADRRAPVDRRSGGDRRSGKAGRRKEDLEISDRRPPERRINEYPLTDEELDFINAVNHYKQKYNKPFPTWSEILHILKSLGYEKRD
jgi:hypothetical protein